MYTLRNKNDTSKYFEFYSKKRSSVSELYASEERIFKIIDFKGKSILDVGCASGGFYNVFKSLSPDIRYFGIDISEQLIGVAKKKYPEIADRFFSGSGTNMHFDNHAFDIVFCSSVQAHCLLYNWLLFECWRVSKEILIFDFRFSFNKKTYNLYNQKSKIPYMVLSINEIFKLLKSLKSVKSISLESYQIVPNKNRLVSQKVSDTSDIWCGLFLIRK